MTPMLLTASGGEFAPLVLHPLEIALFWVLPAVAALVIATLRVAKGRIEVWPTFAVAVFISVAIPLLGGVIALVLVMSRSKVVGGDESATPGGVG